MPLHKRVLDRRAMFPGDVLIREGEYGDSAYYIQDGQFGVYKRAGEDEVLITTLPRGSVVGEMALIDNGRRSASVRCLVAGTIVVVTRATIEEKIKRLDPFMKALLEMFSLKIRRLTDDYCDVERKLQWLLRQTGLPPPPSAREAARHAQTAASQAKPVPTYQEDAATRAAITTLTQEGIDRYHQIKLELAMLYHPDCTHERADETLKRADVFREIWAVLKKIDDGDREMPS